MTAAYPLTPLQQGMLFQALLAPAGGVDVEQVVCRLPEPVDPERLRAAWSRVAARHDVLRARFRWTDVPEPVQEIVPGAEPEWTHDDWSGLAPAEPEARLERWLAEDRARGFDLAAAPAMRLALFRLAADENVLVWTFHHVILDGRSVGHVLGEVFAVHDAAGEGREAELPVRRPFREHVAWLRGRDPAADEAYWTALLRGVGAPERVPGVRRAPRDPAAEPPSGERELVLSAGDTAALRAFEAAEGVWLNTLVQGAWALLLGRYTGSAEAVFGVVRGGRGGADGADGAEEMVGLLINTIPVRVPLPHDARAIDWLEEVGERTATLAPHEHAAPADVRRWSGLPPGAELFDTVLNFQPRPFDAALRARGGRWEGRSFRVLRHPGLPLVLEVAAGERLRARLHHDADLFDAAAADRILDHFARLLRAIAADPGAPLSRLPLVGPGEREALLAAGRAARAFPVAERIEERFARRAAERPDAPAVTSGGSTLTYGELDARADRLARRLRALGVGPETGVGIALERSAGLVVAILATLKAGGAYVPLDPAYPAERIAWVLRDSGAAVLVTAGGLLPRLPAFGGAVLCVDTDQGAAAPEPGGDPAAAGPDSTAYVIYTSGSTGRPKGVQVTHRSVLRLFDATGHWFGFGADDVWTLFHSAAFDFSVWELWGALLHGGRLVVVPFAVSRSPEDFHRLLVEEGVTVLNQTPSAFRQLAEADRVSGTDPRALRLRHVVFGGEALDPRALRPWLDRHGDGRPRLVNMYGITETTVHVTFRVLGRADLERGGSPLGAPIPDLALHLLDRELEPVPPGVPGEIFVGGAGVARGYLGRPELTAERFVPDPFGSEPGARLYRSGDLARRRADGEPEYLGRADRQVKVRGFRIETGEVETALATHPGVAAAAVDAREDAAGEPRLVAYVVAPAGTPAPPPAELRAHLAASLPDYMVPAVFVALDALPLTGNGKLDRRALPAPDGAGRAGAAYAAPRSPAEAALAEAWSEVLGVERVGIDDDYLALGGDSIRSVRVVAAARRRGVAVSVPQLFRHHTVRGLAAAAGTADAGVGGAAGPAEPFALLPPEARAALPPDVEDAYPVSRVQLAMLFHTERDPASLVYQNLNAYRVHAAWDEAAMREALRRVAGRHPALRTSFDLAAAPEPVQRVHRGVEIPLEVADLRGLDSAAQDARMDRERGRGFDWTEPPLLRFHAHLLADGVFRLVLAEHHAVLDGWSVASLMTELLRLYAALRAGAPDPSGAPPAARFRDFVALEREAIASAESRAFWGRVVEDAPPAELPPREGDDEPRADEAPVLWIDLAAGTQAGLRRAAELAGVPLKTTILAAHLRVLALLGGDGDVATGYVTSGRPEVEDGERVLGLFLNTLPLRVRMAGGTWLELVRRTWAAEEALLPHRRFPLAEIVREAGGRTPFETGFNFNHFHVYDALAAAGVRLEADRFFQKTEVPLMAIASVHPASGALRLRLEHDPVRLGAAQVRAIGGWYARALASLADRPDGRWDAAGLLDAEEEARLRRWGAAPAAEHPELPVHRLFEAQAARTPAAEAVVSEGGSLTYAELDARADALARALAARGVGPDSRVGLCVERSPEMVVGILGILKAGGAYVPLDPRFPAERLAFMLRDSGARLLLAHERTRARLPDFAGETVLLGPDGTPGPAAPSPARGQGDPSPDHLACVIYTSGSTGLPKGVGVPHRAVPGFFRGAGYARFDEAQTLLQHSAFSWDVLMLELWPALLAGGRVVLHAGDSADPEALERSVRAHGVTTLWMTAALFNLAVDTRPGLLRQVSQLIVGGEALSLPHVRRALEEAPGLRLVNGYGPTECTVFTTCQVLTPAAAGRGIVPIGAPVGDRRVHVLDAGMGLVPVGVPGELCVGGPAVPRGYLGRPELTAEKLVPDPFSAGPGARLYRTGDRVRWRADGVLEFLGRMDRQVKVRGFRIEPEEIEAALLEHPAVERAVVTVHADPAAGARLAAHVVARGGARPDPAGLRRHLRERLPEHMVPSAVALLDALPLTPNGKVDRRALPAPDFGAASGDGAPHVEPRTPTERALAAVWAEVLGVGRVGAGDDFLALGGHSLLAIRALARIRRELGCDPGLAALLEGCPLADVAAAMDAERAAGPARAEPGIARRPRTPAAPF